MIYWITCICVCVCYRVLEWCTFYSLSVRIQYVRVCPRDWCIHGQHIVFAVRSMNYNTVVESKLGFAQNLSPQKEICIRLGEDCSSVCFWRFRLDFWFHQSYPPSWVSGCFWVVLGHLFASLSNVFLTWTLTFGGQPPRALSFPVLIMDLMVFCWKLG